MPSMMSFITCEPTSSVPTQPKSTQIQGFTSRRNRKSETSCQLPGGRIVESRTARSEPPLPLRELLIRPSTTSKLEKKSQEHVEGYITGPSFQRARASTLRKDESMKSRILRKAPEFQILSTRRQY